jgi:hypothetical protein
MHPQQRRSQKYRDRPSHRRGATEFARILGLAALLRSTTAYGSPALRVDGQIFAGIAVNKSAEPNSLMICIDVDQRDALLAEQPDIYYVTDHYADHPRVLVRLARVDRDALEDLLRMAHRFVTANPQQRPNSRGRKARRRRPSR